MDYKKLIAGGLVLLLAGLFIGKNLGAKAVFDQGRAAGCNQLGAAVAPQGVLACALDKAGQLHVILAGQDAANLDQPAQGR